MPNGDCPIGAANRADIQSIRGTLEQLDAEDQRQWHTMNELRQLLQRPPAWCAWAMTALGSIAGGAIGALVTLLLKGGG
jgi:hypothetical protein